MTSIRPVRTVLLALAAILVLVGVPSATAAAAFADPAGDQLDKPDSDLIGPDITAVEVTNTRSGTITFRATIANYASLPAHSTISLLFDLDKNNVTGDQGFEYAISYEIDPAGQSRLVFERFEESLFTLVEIPATSLSATFSSGVLTVSVPRSELANTTTFDFGLFAVVFNANESDVAGDVGPDAGIWTYDLDGLPAPRLSASKLVLSPMRPVAGRPFSVSAVVTRSDTGAVIKTGSVTCKVRLGKTSLRAAGTFRDQSARCTMAIPRTAKGKTLSGSLTVRTVGAVVTKRFIFRVL